MTAASEAITKRPRMGEDKHGGLFLMCTRGVRDPQITIMRRVEKLLPSLKMGPVAWCPRQDSNLRSRLRRAVLYPLSYGGSTKSRVDRA
jgi:hypothetical protein